MPCCQAFIILEILPWMTAWLHSRNPDKFKFSVSQYCRNKIFFVHLTTSTEKEKARTGINWTVLIGSTFFGDAFCNVNAFALNQHQWSELRSGQVGVIGWLRDVDDMRWIRCKTKGNTTKQRPWRFSVSPCRKKLTCCHVEANTLKRHNSHVYLGNDFFVSRILL